MIMATLDRLRELRDTAEELASIESQLCYRNYFLEQAAGYQKIIDSLEKEAGKCGPSSSS